MSLLLLRVGRTGGQADALATPGVEVAVVEPVVEGRTHARPLQVGDREPVGVAVAALVDDGVAEATLPDEAEPDRGPARRGVEAVALPLVGRPKAMPPTSIEPISGSIRMSEQKPAARPVSTGTMAYVT
jgi:hypothetical protein